MDKNLLAFYPFFVCSIVSDFSNCNLYQQQNMLSSFWLCITCILYVLRTKHYYFPMRKLFSQKLSIPWFSISFLSLHFCFVCAFCLFHCDCLYIDSLIDSRTPHNLVDMKYTHWERSFLNILYSTPFLNLSKYISF